MPDDESIHVNMGQCPACPPCNEHISIKRISPDDLLLSIALDGIVVNDEDAKRGPCECVKTDGSQICWDKGIIGALSKEQQDKYCKGNVTYKKLSSKMQNRLETFKDASETCEIGKVVNGMKINNFMDRIKCMSELAKE